MGGANEFSNLEKIENNLSKCMNLSVPIFWPTSSTCARIIGTGGKPSTWLPPGNSVEHILIIWTCWSRFKVILGFSSKIAILSLFEVQMWDLSGWLSPILGYAECWAYGCKYHYHSSWGEKYGVQTNVQISNGFLMVLFYWSSEGNLSVPIFGPSSSTCARIIP